MREIFNILQKKYVTSEVTSGQMIYSVKLSTKFSRPIVRKGIQAFLDWDESEETFILKKTKSGKNWKIVCK